jgi:hypothetical protein
MLKDGVSDIANEKDLKAVAAINKTDRSRTHAKFVLTQVLKREPTEDELTEGVSAMSVMDRWGDANPDTESNVPELGMHSMTRFFPNPNGMALSDKLYIHQSLAERAFLAKYPEWYNFVKDNNAKGDSDDAAIDSIIETAMEAESQGNPVTPPDVVFGKKGSWTDKVPALVNAISGGLDDVFAPRPNPEKEGGGEVPSNFWGQLIKTLVQVGGEIIPLIMGG